MNNNHKNAGTMVFIRILKAERTREGMSVGQVPEQFGVSRRTVYKWLASFRAGGEAALENRSSTPLRSTRRLPVE